MTFTNAKQRFSNRVADYVRYRPSYPAALLDLLASECGLRSSHTIADIGSGTGLLSKLFSDNGNRLYGVEPNAEMRAAGEEFLRDHPNFTSIDGSAEATELPDGCADFITAGQAFHWFDVEKANGEFRRVLKPDGWVVVVWQDRRMEETPFAREYEHLLERFGVDYKKVKDAYPETNKIRHFFDAGTFRSCDLPNQQILGWDGLRGRLTSSSYAPTEKHENYAPMMAELRRIFDAYQQNGSVRMEYFARVYFGKLGGNKR
ncbi:MAG: class I SAM-dependent methyltransferase [Candidatus Acidiferrum sp.]